MTGRAPLDVDRIKSIFGDENRLHYDKRKRIPRDGESWSRQCHAGYGYTDNDFDFADARNVDCLVCHDNSATYTKTAAGLPSPDVDLKYVA